MAVNVPIHSRLRTLLLLIFSTVLPWSASAEKPDIDVAADSPAFETLRRKQTQSGALLPTQAFPQSERAVGKYLESVRLSPADTASLSLSLPGFRRELLHWEDSARSHSFYLSPAMELGWHGETLQDSDDAALLTGLGVTLFGQLAPNLSYFSHGMIYTESTDKAQFTPVQPGSRRDLLRGKRGGR